jgi:hypothetical protein
MKGLDLGRLSLCWYPLDSFALSCSKSEYAFYLSLGQLSLVWRIGGGAAE